MLKKRKICFVLTSLIHYSRNFLILEELKKRSDIELHIILGGAVISDKYSSHKFNVKKTLENEGYQHIHEAYFNLEGDTHIIKAKTVGLGLLEFSALFNEIKPDLVLVRGDRFEVLAAVVAAAHMNLPIAHIEGGDVSGTFDESVRHAITKFAQIHFVTNAPAYQRVIRMGEDPKYVFNFGSPDIEVVRKIKSKGSGSSHINLESSGSGARFNAKQPYLIVMFHPTTNELEKLPHYTQELLNAVYELDIQAVWFWPNFDAGAEFISHPLRVFRDNIPEHKIKFLRYLPPKQFLTLLNGTGCLVGNSSAGIKECSYLGVPVVNVGSRQNQRLRTENVLDCGNSREEVKEAIKHQLKIGRYTPSDLYSAENTSREIAKVLAAVPLYTQKTFVDEYIAVR